MRCNVKNAFSWLMSNLPDLGSLVINPAPNVDVPYNPDSGNDGKSFQFSGAAISGLNRIVYANDMRDLLSGSVSVLASIIGGLL